MTVASTSSPAAASGTRPARVIELLGLAGAGKSALLEELCGEGDGVVAARSVWNQRRGVLATSALRSMTELMAILRETPRIGMEPLKHAVRLRALAEDTDRARAGRPGALVIDEGPLFALAWFDVFAPRAVGGARFERWRRGVLAHWSAALDLVVLLDAPDSLLMRRIRTRDKEHPVKDGGDEEILGFLVAFRRAFARVLADLPAGPTVLQVASDHEAPAAIARRVRLALTTASPPGRRV